MTALIARKPPVEDLTHLPRDWHHGNQATTHLMHRLIIAVSEMELFLVRIYRRALAEGAIEDPALAAEVRGFMKQEAAHARYHRLVYDLLEHHGYEIQSVVRRQRARLAELARTLPLDVLLSIAAAGEHHFTSIGAWYLKHGESLGLPPAIHALLLWHSAEEIEHQAVAHDVYHAVCAPTWRHRMRGYGQVARLVRGLALEAFAHLLDQEPELTVKQARRDVRRMVWRHRAVVLSQIANALAYLRPSLHPRDRNYTHLADTHFAAQTYELVGGQTRQS